jgi:hypothetical protein
VAADDRAVVIGINRYPALGDLEGPENDACAFVDWLTAAEGGNVPKDNVSCVLSSQYDPPTELRRAEPTVRAVQEAFDGLVDHAETMGGKAGRRLYIFMAGHGFARELETAALLMANAAKGRTGYHIPGPLYAKVFVQSATFDEVVLFMDCCRERYPQAPVQLPPYELLSARRPARHLYGLAAEWSQAARERPSTDGQVRGVFTEALLAGLWGKARDDQGTITGASLKKYVYNAVKAGSEPGKPVQEPEFQPMEEKAQLIVFAENVAAPRFLIRASLTAANGGQTLSLFFGGDLETPIPGQQAGDAWQWEVHRAGIYKVQASRGDSRFVEVVTKETIDVQL